MLRAPGRVARRSARATARRLSTELDVLRTRRGRADLAIFHEFAPPPSGGGHQFLRALVRELEGRGLDGRAEPHLGRDAGLPLQLVQLRRRAPAAVRRTRRADGAPRRRPDRRLPRVRRRHRRVDRDGERRARVRDDRPVAVLAREAPRARARAAATRWSSRTPSIRRSSIPRRAASRSRDGRVRLVATSWSDNPRKGGDTLAWLDRNLDPARFELTFAGRAPTAFERVHVVGPLDSHALATLLRTQDVYLAPSCDDPCSNALLEALACGLPAAYPRQRRASRARRRGGPALPGGRRARRRARPARRRARRAAGVDLDPSDRMGRRPLPRGPRAARRRLESRDRAEPLAPRNPRTRLSHRQAARPRRRLARA